MLTPYVGRLNCRAQVSKPRPPALLQSNPHDRQSFFLFWSSTLSRPSHVARNRHLLSAQFSSSRHDDPCHGQPWLFSPSTTGAYLLASRAT